MPQKGTYTALQKLKPIATDFGKIIKEDEQLQFKYRAEAAAKKAAEDAKKAAITEGFMEDYEALTDVITNTTSIDEANIRGVMKARDLRYKVYKETRDNPSLKDTPKFALMRANLKNFSKTLEGAEKKYTESTVFLTKGMQDGTLSDYNKKDLADRNSVFIDKNLDISVDPNTGEAIALIIDLDPETLKPKLNSDGSKKLKRMNLAKVFDGTGIGDAVQWFDFEKETRAIGSALGAELSTKKDKKSGYFAMRTVQKWEDKKESVRGTIKAALGSLDRPNDTAKSIWVDHMGQEPPEDDTFTEEQMKQIEDKFLNSVGVYYDQKDELDPNYGAAIAAANAKAAKKTSITPTITRVTGTDRPEIVEHPTKIDKKGNPIKGYDIALATGEGLVISKSKTSISSIQNIQVYDGEYWANVTTNTAKGNEAIDLGDNADMMTTVLAKLAGGTWESDEGVPRQLKAEEVETLVKNDRLKKEDGTQFKNSKDFTDYAKEKYDIIAPKEGYIGQER
tara:strand:+ start:47527 stop:49047 length:1521 start_codon:yes stop_codon:yes gene_type:complete